MHKNPHRQEIILVILISIFILMPACSPTPIATDAPIPAPTNTAKPTDTSPPPPELRPTETEALSSESPGPDDPAGTDITIQLPEGDYENGLKLSRRNACFACHEFNNAGPSFNAEGDLPEIVERAGMRISDPHYTGTATTPEQYLIESIVLANEYIVPGEWDQKMGSTLGNTLTVQELADLIAWVTSGKTAETP